ncbi:outer membrane protein with beta-barrel domain [Roseivirga pacifica]|uniref:Outer membrane protein beta-barrel domain-containing protein n=1 Tax=Roseivirga pacifica TaxID=1267423 RepID=A0A1I0QMV5_9BACT|nr:outer membrane beta-barrel protein [Roseivirga pacifica]RKQ42774.1 outer membrane protein with beta-barrel domain [Roseivirga pacifica]SEW28647.1 Outer membrane protein beta-barrel domain-containing protein [Roseivirga pacifica]
MKTALTSILLLLVTAVYGQSTWGFNAYAFLPTGELKNDSPEVWGGGFAFEVAATIKQSPIYLGGQLDITRYGSEVRDGYHGPDLGEIRLRRNYEMARMLGLVRFKPDCGINFYPYFDFLIGPSYIYTRATLRDDSFSEPFDHYFDLDDFTISYGFGAGVEIFLHEYLILDLHLKSMTTGRVEYLTPSAVHYNNSEDYYELDIQNSSFDNLNLGVGIKLVF